MIATEGERDFSQLQRFDYQLRVLGTGCRNFLQIFSMRVAFFLLLGDGHGNVATIFDFVAESFEARFESSNAHSRRAHVDTAAGLTEIKGNANDADFARNDGGGRRACSHHRFQSTWIEAIE